MTKATAVAKTKTKATKTKSKFETAADMFHRIINEATTECSAKPQLQTELQGLLIYAPKKRTTSTKAATSTSTETLTTTTLAKEATATATATAAAAETEDEDENEKETETTTEEAAAENNIILKVEIWAQLIQGIMFYIDRHGNVYKTEDVLQDKINPEVVAKYIRNSQNGEISLIELPNSGVSTKKSSDVTAIANSPESS